MLLCVCVCSAEQLESFKKHMEAGETNTPAILLGAETEEDVENGECVCVCRYLRLCTPVLLLFVLVCSHFGC